jgi:hypothetical protein
MFMTRLKRLPVISREHFRKTRTNYLILVSQIPICKMESQILALKQQEEEQQQSGYKSRASTKYVLAAKKGFSALLCYSQHITQQIAPCEISIFHSYFS